MECRKHLSALICLLLATSLVNAAERELETAYQWQYIDYIWPSAATKREAIETGAYNYTNIMPMDVDVAQDGRVFVTALNFPGVPARLGVVSRLQGESGPLIQPYPSWAWTDKNNCNSIIDVYRITIDRCNRLWVLDSGKSYSAQNPTKCPPKLLAFDLATDTPLHAVILPPHIAINPQTGLSLMANVKVETYGQHCEDTTVYMADANGDALIIWDGQQFVRLEHPSFLPVPGAGNISTGSESTDVSAGLVGMDLTPSTHPNEPRYLYLRPIASYGLYGADTQQLRSSIYGGPVRIFGVDNVLSSQSIGQAFSSEGTLFLGLTKEIALACWNRYKKLAPENIEILVQDSQRLQYANGIKVIPPPIRPEEEVWALTNRYPAFTNRKLNFSESNFFVLRSPVKTLIAGTGCEKP